VKVARGESVTRRNRILRVLTVLVLMAIAFAAGALVFGRGEPQQRASGERRILYYRNPMNPEVTSPTPMKDPMGMDYVPGYADEPGTGGSGTSEPPPGAGPEAVRIDPHVIQQTGVTTERAERRALSRTLRTVGIVQPDERRLYSVTVKFAGWVERLYVNFTGDRVRRGQPLARIYSPELLATQREYLLALRYVQSLGPEASAETRTEAGKLLDSAHQRLRLWDISERQIRALARRGEPTRTMTIHASSSGVVLEKEITAGSRVEPGMTLLRIADLREVWVFAQIYPYQLPWLRLGQSAAVEVPGLPDETLEGRVNYIQPIVTAEARTVEVRIQVSQPGETVRLKPNMYANVEIRSEVQEEAVAIPEQAILRTGERNVAIVALGGGYFEPREVELGATADRYVEILEGIEPGEEVVTSAQFLIDSESNLRAALNAMGGRPQGHEGHSMGGSGQPPSPEPAQEPATPEQGSGSEAPPPQTPDTAPGHEGHGAPGGSP